jgi:hypothetical protein
VLLDDDRAREREPLAAAPARLLGREERFIDPVLELGRDARPVVSDVLPMSSLRELNPSLAA